MSCGYWPPQFRYVLCCEFGNFKRLDGGCLFLELCISSLCLDRGVFYDLLRSIALTVSSSIVAACWSANSKSFSSVGISVKDLSGSSKACFLSRDQRLFWITWDKISTSVFEDSHVLGCFFSTRWQNHRRVGLFFCWQVLKLNICNWMTGAAEDR